jgi:formylglycine-generating enzyme required for sulfatase activity
MLSYFKDPSRPVERVSWHDAKAFIQRLRNRAEVKAFLVAQNLSQAQFRLPSEAEWEYAARGGVHSQGYEYCGSDDLRQVGWYRNNSGVETKPVGLLLSNELGLYDMSGNVGEWCEDDWHDSYDAPGLPDDGSAWVDSPERGTDRVIRGGDYFFSRSTAALRIATTGTPATATATSGFGWCCPSSFRSP